jgi:hypothetical protein
MAKVKNFITVEEKTLNQLIKLCQAQTIILDCWKNQIQQQGYETNYLKKKIELIEICIQKKKKEH